MGMAEPVQTSARTEAVFQSSGILREKEQGGLERLAYQSSETIANSLLQLH